MSAKILFHLLIICCVSFSMATVHLDLKPLLDQQFMVMHQMVNTMSSETISGRAAAVDINACFNWYRNDQAEITETYDTEYNKCISTTANEKKLLSEQSALQRSELIGDGRGFCASLSSCESLIDGLEFFSCYNSASGLGAKGLLTISSDSEAILNNLTILYQRVDDEERVCTADAKNVYINSLSTSATNLNQCLAGKWVPPTETTTTQATTTTTTEAITTTQATKTTEEDTTTPEEVTTTEAVPRKRIQDPLPEEDIYRYIPMTRMNKWNTLRRL